MPFDYTSLTDFKYEFFFGRLRLCCVLERRFKAFTKCRYFVDNKLISHNFH